MVNSFILGLWFFSSLIYNDMPMPRPNPDLIMSFQFLASGVSVLHYERLNEDGFCERRADYSFENNILTQTVTWVHPQNASFCQQDLDMRIGQKSETSVELIDGVLYMHLPLGEDQLTYVWTKSYPTFQTKIKNF